MSTLIGAGITDQDKAHFAVFEAFADAMFLLMKSYGIARISSPDGAVICPEDKMVKGLKVEFTDADDKEDA